MASILMIYQYYILAICLFDVQTVMMFILILHECDIKKY